MALLQMDSLDEKAYAAAIKVKYLVFLGAGSTLVFCSYLPMLRWKDLAAAVKYIHKFDGMVGKSLNWPCQTKRRIVIGFVIGLTSNLSMVRLTIILRFFNHHMVVHVLYISFPFFR